MRLLIFSAEQLSVYNGKRSEGRKRMVMSFFDPNKRKQNQASRVSMALFRLSQALKRLSQQQSDPHGLSPIQVQALFFIYHTREDMCSVGNFAKAIGTTHATAVEIIRGLMAKQLVYKTNKPDDKRVSLLKLTDQGQTAVNNLEEWGSALEKTVGDVPDEMLQQFEIVLGAILHSLRERGHLVVAEPCLGCVHFEPDKRAVQESDKRHFCKAIEKYLSHAESLKECPEHTPT